MSNGFGSPAEAVLPISQTGGVENSLHDDEKGIPPLLRLRHRADGGYP
jgi:hypothetical protein